MKSLRPTGLIVMLVLWALAGPAQAAKWPGTFTGWWLTPDQQGQRLVAKGEYLEAADAFRDPARKGAAFFRGGDCESAASGVGRLPGAAAADNRGKALFMLGR